MARDFESSGSNNYLTSATPPVTAVPLTISAWVKPETAPAGACICAITDTAGSVNFFSLRIGGGGPSFQATTAATAESSAVASVVVGAGVWQHGCAVFAGATSRAAYRNGTAKGTDATSRTPAGIDLVSVGRLGHIAPSGYFDGLIAELCIWNVALNDGEVEALGNRAHALGIRPASIVAYWPLFGLGSPEPDYSGGGRHVTVAGATLSGEHAPVAPSQSGQIWLPSVSVVTYDWTLTGFSLPVSFGAPSLSATVAPLEFPVPVGIGSPALAPGVAPAGLSVPVAFGAASLRSTLAPYGWFVPVTFGSYPAPLLADDFDDGVIDPGLWSQGNQAPVVMAEVGGALQFVAQGAVNGVSYVQLAGARRDLRDTEVSLRLDALANVPLLYMMIQHFVAGTSVDWYDIRYSQGYVQAYWTVASVTTKIGEVSGLVTTPSRLRVRHSGGTSFFEYQQSTALSNPGFEVNTTGWSFSPNTTGVRDTAEKHSGDASLKMTVASGTFQGCQTQQPMLTKPGQSWTASWWVKAPLGAVGNIALAWYTAAPTTFISWNVVPYTGTGGWQRMTATATAPATAASLSVAYRTDVAGVHWLDSAEVLPADPWRPLCQIASVPMPIEDVLVRLTVQKSGAAANGTFRVDDFLLSRPPSVAVLDVGVTLRPSGFVVPVAVGTAAVTYPRQVTGFVVPVSFGAVQFSLSPQGVVFPVSFGVASLEARLAVVSFLVPVGVGVSSALARLGLAAFLVPWTSGFDHEVIPYLALFVVVDMEVVDLAVEVESVDLGVTLEAVERTVEIA